MRATRTTLIVLLVGISAATSCQSTKPTESGPTQTLVAPLMDTSLFTGKPCDAPCWFGLELGKSTEKDAIAVLPGLSFIDQDTIDNTVIGYWDPVKQENVRASLISASCAQPENVQCVGLTISEDRLKIVGLFPNYAIDFEDLIRQLGSPDYVVANPVPPVHLPGCSLRLVWIDRQIVADHTEGSESELCDDLRSRKGEIRTLLVHSINYFLPEYIELIVNSGNAHLWD